MTNDKPRALGDTALFKPIQVGANKLSNRVVYVPTTRVRSLPDHVTSDLNVQYYDDRTKTPGSLVITEATPVSPQAGGYDNSPGIWTHAQARGYKAVVDKIHANGSYAAIQLWYIGKAASPAILKRDGLDYVSVSDLYTDDAQKEAALKAGNPLRGLTTEEIDNLIDEVYPNAARNSIAAGFDYFEIHAAHGYLLDHFHQVTYNNRSDKYGGSIENRARLILSIIDRLGEEFGYNKVAIRISPWARASGMIGRDAEVHPVAQFGYLLSELAKRAKQGKQIAYVSVVEPRVSGSVNVDNPDYSVESNDFVPLIWPGPILKAGNYTYDSPTFDSLLENIQNDRTLIGFSRFFTSNPDLVERLRNGDPLTPYDRSTFYTNDNWGYNTFVKYGEVAKFDEAAERERKPGPSK